MKPYYQRDGITIFCGDCKKIMPKMNNNSFELVLTDPPYPELKGGTVYLDGGVAPRVSKSATTGTPWEISLNWMSNAWRVAKLGMMVFCSYHSVDTVKAKQRSAAIALVTWHKRNSPNPVNNVPKFETEFIWLFKKTPGLTWRSLRTMYDIPMPQAGCFATERILKKDSKCAAHPTQKPEALVFELLKVGGQTILDPFMGTGTTLKVAQDLGRRATGIEINPAYCQMAVERLRQPSFWSITDSIPIKPKNEQLELL